MNRIAAANRWYWGLVLTLCVYGVVACGDASNSTGFVIATISATPAALLADGKASAKVDVEIKWVDGDAPASGYPVEIRSSRGQDDVITPTQGQTDDEGRFTGSISSSKPGEATLTLFSGATALCRDDLEQCHPAQVRVTFTEKKIEPPADCAATLDGNVIGLTKTVGKSSYPVAASSAGKLVLAYDQDDSTSTSSPFLGKRQVFVARFDKQGAMIGQVAAISNKGDNAYRPSIVANDQGFALVYAQEQTPNSIMFVELKADGTPEAAPKAIATGYYNQPRIAYLEEKKGYGVAFHGKAGTKDKSTTWFVALDSAGKPGKITQVTTDNTGSSPTYPTIASDGTNAAIAWQDRRNGSWDLYFRLVRPDGSFASKELEVRKELNSVSVAAQLIWTGSEYGLVFSDTRKAYGHFQIYLARIAADGAQVLSETAITTASGNADTPGATFWKGNYWISWIEKAWCGDAQPFGPKANSPVIDQGADLGMAFTGAAQDIGAVEFGLPWGGSTSLSTTVHLAVFDPLKKKVTSQLKVADNKAFSAFPALAVVDDKLRTVWYDAPGGQRDLYGATILCNKP
jgi:Bacterial Ig-like domain (group 1)